MSDMFYEIVADGCEMIGDCIAVCPVECVHWAVDQRGERLRSKLGIPYAYIDGAVCVDCGACRSSCPIEAAIIQSNPAWVIDAGWSTDPGVRELLEFMASRIPERGDDDPERLRLLMRVLDRMAELHGEGALSGIDWGQAHEGSGGTGFAEEWQRLIRGVRAFNPSNRAERWRPELGAIVELTILQWGSATMDELRAVAGRSMP